MSVHYTSYSSEVQAAIKAAKAQGLEICGGVCEGHAKDYCPVRTGALRNSIAHEQKDEDTEAIGTTMYYAPYVELGTCKMNAKPFLRPALDNHRGEYIAIFESLLGNL